MQLHTEDKKVLRIRRLIVGLILVATCTFLCVRANNNVGESYEERTQEAAPGWERAVSNLWTGVKLYYGEGHEKLYVGEVLGGNNHYVDPWTGRKFRGLKILTKSGTTEWKDRDAVVLGPWYVRREDPALRRWEWQEYSF